MKTKSSEEKKEGRVIIISGLVKISIPRGSDIVIKDTFTDIEAIIPAKDIIRYIQQSEEYKNATVMSLQNKNNHEI